MTRRPSTKKIGALGTVISLGALLLGSMPASGQESGQERGKALFEGAGTCFACHAQDGSGTPVGPDLTDSEWLHFQGHPTAEDILALLKEGVSDPAQYPAPMMPRGGSGLNDDDLAAVARYVLTLSGTDR